MSGGSTRPAEAAGGLGGFRAADAGEDLAAGVAGCGGAAGEPPVVDRAGAGKSGEPAPGRHFVALAFFQKEVTRLPFVPEA